MTKKQTTKNSHANNMALDLDVKWQAPGSWVPSFYAGGGLTYVMRTDVISLQEAPPLKECVPQHCTVITPLQPAKELMSHSEFLSIKRLINL